MGFARTRTFARTPAPATILSVKEDSKRLVRALAGAAAEVMPPGVRPLFQQLLQERVRRFFRWLGGDDEAARSEAEKKLAEICETPDGEKLVRHVYRDVLFGTERISTAGMANIASAVINGDGDRFWIRAATIIDGLHDDDAFCFVAILSHFDDFDVEPGAWATAVKVDLQDFSAPHWRGILELVGLTENELLVSIDTCVGRRLFWPTDSRGVMGGMTDVAPRRALLVPDTARLYRLLVRSMEMAAPELFTAIGPEFKFDTIDGACMFSERSP